MHRDRQKRHSILACISYKNTYNIPCTYMQACFRVLDNISVGLEISSFYILALYYFSLYDMVSRKLLVICKVPTISNFSGLYVFMRACVHTCSACVRAPRACSACTLCVRAPRACSACVRACSACMRAQRTCSTCVRACVHACVRACVRCVRACVACVRACMHACVRACTIFRPHDKNDTISIRNEHSIDPRNECRCYLIRCSTAAAWLLVSEKYKK